LLTYRIRVAGRVQGVGFRTFVAELARRAGLDGTVRNLQDGSVEVLLACADEAALAEIEASLRHGPGIVRDLFCEAVDAPVEPGFRILPTA
jgi:acylphosphatase